MDGAIEVPAVGVRVPAAAITWRAVRSSGPGGQNVNKVASKVEVRVSVAAIEGLDEAARARLGRLGRRWLTVDGELVITSDRTRDQARNLEDARGRLAELLLRAATPPRPRRKTRPTAGSVERRLAATARASRRKQDRRAPAGD